MARPTLERLPWFRMAPADYLLDTLDLSHAAHGIYCILIFTYYWQGSLPSNRERLYALARASDAPAQAAVEQIAKRFFHETGDKLFHNRIERELYGLQEFLTHQSAAGKASAAARQQQQQPKKLSKGNCADADPPFELPAWIPPESWSAWLEIRKKKRAPNTVHALRLAISKLETLKSQGQSPRAVLEQSTLRAYTGLFPIAAQVGDKPDYTALYEKLGVDKDAQK